MGALLRELADGTGRLVRQELRLAGLELREVVASVGIGTVQLAVGAALVVLGSLAFIAGIILLAGDQWLRDRYWLAALIATVLLAVVAGWLARRGLGHLSPARLAPDQTVQSLKEDKEWLKRQLTSGATSS